jgi:hypothetical protein
MGRKSLYRSVRRVIASDYNFYAYCFKKAKERLMIKVRVNKYSPLSKRKNEVRNDKGPCYSEQTGKLSTTNTHLRKEG